jgi:hypothetical protein
MPGQIPNMLLFSSLLYIYSICVYIHTKERRPIKNISDRILSGTQEVVNIAAVHKNSISIVILTSCETHL